MRIRLFFFRLRHSYHLLRIIAMSQAKVQAAVEALELKSAETNVTLAGISAELRRIKGENDPAALEALASRIDKVVADQSAVEDDADTDLPGVPE